MTTTLIFSPEIFGHYCEYLHHIYEQALKRTDEKFVFAVPENFKEISNNMVWKDGKNISFLYFPPIRPMKPLKRVCMLHRFIKETGADHVFLPSLMTTLPWLPFFVPAKVKVSGIVYLIYLYRQGPVSVITKIADWIKYAIFSYSRIFDCVFLLNDKVAPRYLNRKFKTKKFKWLPDPIAILPETTIENLRQKWNIPEDTQIFAHFGTMNKRKGTLEILEAICRDVPANTCFVFAGEVRQDIHEKFYEYVERARSKGANIMVFDAFCSYDFLMNLSRTADAILIPYKNTEQSSGIIAYAAATGTPVFCPESGLLGNIVRNYQLGKTFKDISATGIAEAFSVDWRNFSGNGTQYLEDNALSIFQEKIFSSK